MTTGRLPGRAGTCPVQPAARGRGHSGGAGPALRRGMEAPPRGPRASGLPTAGGRPRRNGLLNTEQSARADRYQLS